VSAAAPDVGRRIALMRRRLGFSQVAFARRAGISRNALVDYERGVRIPKSGPLSRIAAAADTSLDWLLNGRAPKVQPSDREWDAAIRALRAVWRDPTRRRVTLSVLAALGKGRDSRR
jgi:transcriptional regulator with XRE-family HTH domain